MCPYLQDPSADAVAHSTEPVANVIKDIVDACQLPVALGNHRCGMQQQGRRAAHVEIVSTYQSLWHVPFQELACELTFAFLKAGHAPLFFHPYLWSALE